MSKLTALLASVLLLTTAGSALAEPPPTAARKSPAEPLWFEVPALATAPRSAARRPARPRVKLTLKKSRYGDISLESLAARERGTPVIDCAAACGGRQMKRKPKAVRPDRRTSDLTQAVQLYR